MKVYRPAVFNNENCVENMEIDNITCADDARQMINELRMKVEGLKEEMKRSYSIGRRKMMVVRIKEDNTKLFGYDTLRVIFTQWFDESSDKEIRRMAYEHIESDVRLRNKQYYEDMREIAELRKEAMEYISDYRIKETKLKQHIRSIKQLSEMIKEMESSNKEGIVISNEIE